MTFSVTHQQDSSLPFLPLVSALAAVLTRQFQALQCHCTSPVVVCTAQVAVMDFQSGDDMLHILVRNKAPKGRRAVELVLRFLGAVTKQLSSTYALFPRRVCTSSVSNRRMPVSAVTQSTGWPACVARLARQGRCCRGAALSRRDGCCSESLRVHVSGRLTGAAICTCSCRGCSGTCCFTAEHRSLWLDTQSATE